MTNRSWPVPGSQLAVPIGAPHLTVRVAAAAAATAAAAAAVADEAMTTDDIVVATDRSTAWLIWKDGMTNQAPSVVKIKHLTTIDANVLNLSWVDRIQPSDTGAAGAAGAAAAERHITPDGPSMINNASVSRR